MPLKKELIYIDGKDETDKVAKYFYKADKCVVVFKNSNREFLYSKKRARIVKTAYGSKQAVSVFHYLKEIADTVGLKTEYGYNKLLSSYDDISRVPEDCVISQFLNAKQTNKQYKPSNSDFFPFGFNLSQKEAVTNAFAYDLSVIEGPPGTGKTQTILNIIAHAMLNGQSVAVVSSNNSATKNVYEKLEKNGLDFIAAVLGNAENKKEFIDSQKDIPELSKFDLTDAQLGRLKKESKQLFAELTDKLEKKNELALLKQQYVNIQTEYRHFTQRNKDNSIASLSLKKKLSADKALRLWVKLESFAEKQSKIGKFRRFIYRLRYGIKDKSFFAQSLEEMILICQESYYKAKIQELKQRKSILEKDLQDFAFDQKMNAHTEKSMQIFKAALYSRYSRRKRAKYTIQELRQKSKEFIKDYPVIMSTTYSLRQSLSGQITYDYVVIDEASQVDLATGTLALSCAKRAVIVGDTKQLPNVVDRETQLKTDTIFDSYTLNESYRYSTHSLLSSILDLFPNIPKTLLREHYRCHPQIIEFCNQKFYGNQLIVLTEQTEKRAPLAVYKTVKGNHARERMNQRQIDIIKHEIIPNEKLENLDLGIVTPYRNQTNALQQSFQGSSIIADTVDKFQGRENQVIILSTVDNEITEFTDNPNRLNVAVSRAMEQLILVVNGNEEHKDGNISDLIQYIEYNNFSIVQSKLNSIFDLLYKGYEKERAKHIRKSGRASDFDSENLMYALIKEVLKDDRFKKYDVLLHFPFSQLIKDISALDEEELKYASNPLTHLDFLIYNKLGKLPIMAVEVDGYAFHKEGSRQAERDKLKNRILKKYNFPILRFRTNESNEKEKLIKKLNELQNLS